MLHQLPILQILIPLISGILTFVFPNRFSWLISLFAIAITTIISLSIFGYCLNNIEPIYYHLGGWAPNIGIEYKIDSLNSFFIFFICLINSLNIFAMKDLVLQEIDEKRKNLFYGILLISITGLLGICISNDIFNIYVMLEINAISAYALVASGKKIDSAKAGFNYLIFGTIGSTMILFGIGFLYGSIGSLNLNIISNQMPQMLDNNAVRAGAGLIIFGILMKAALFPFGKFLCGIYQGAPSFISSMLASSSNKVAVYLLIIFFFSVFKFHKYSFEYLDITLLLFSVIAIFYCSIKAYKQTNIKKFLAFSSFSQIGFIVFALALASKISLAGLLIYCFTHALEKSALFLAAGYLIYSFANSEELESFAGIRKKYPFLCVLIVINLLSNIGIPMTAGFVGKWLLLKASFATALWFVLIIILASLFTFYYAFKFIDLILFKKEDSEPVISQNISAKTCIWGISILTALNIYIGINNQYLLKYAHQISQLILK